MLQTRKKRRIDFIPEKYEALEIIKRVTLTIASY